MPVLRTGILLLTFGFCATATARAAVNDPQLHAESVSRQFTVMASDRARPHLASQGISTKLGLIQLTPAVAAVNCERVKDALMRLLRQGDRWRGKIVVAILPAAVGDLSVAIVPTLYASGWQYRVELPAELPAERFVSVITQTLLLEMANRPGGDRCAELPLWLSEGVALMISRGEVNLLAEPSVSRELTTVALDPLAKPRLRFAGRPALTFDELSWPSSAQLRGEGRETFRDSAQLFVHSLLARNGGGNSLADFVARLGGTLNWQTSFLKAFRQDFGLLIDVEKWWAVSVAAFSGRNQWQMWSPEDSMTRLDEALRVGIEQSPDRETLPERVTITLQKLIREWDYASQVQAMNNVLRQLSGLRMNCPPELSQLVDEYRGTLETYASKRSGAPAATIRGELGAGAKLSVRETLQRLDELDARREMWRREYAVARSEPTR